MLKESFRANYSFWKEIYVELENYEFFHSPSIVGKIDKRFRGRKLIENKLYNILKGSKVKSGAYLITGYRGVGKTSLVNKVLSRRTHFQFKKFPQLTAFLFQLKIRRPNAPIVVKVNLGHDELKEKDILNLIAKTLLEQYGIWYARLTPRLYAFLPKVIFAFLFSYWIGKALYSSMSKWFQFLEIGWFSQFQDIKVPPDWVQQSIYFLIFYFILVVAQLRMFGNSIPNNKVALRRLRFLGRRIDSMVTHDNGAGFKQYNFSLSFSRKNTYPIADSRDIEVMLIGILEYIERIWLPRPRFVFVFDELDKIEAHQNQSIVEKEEFTYNSTGYSTSAELMRKRQQATSKILANLKHFFTTARAKFIFIAGREMYDATLADISDRNYFLGSIFHDVIYVHSFLTEDPEQLNKGRAGQTDGADDSKHTSYYHSMVEEFLCQFLMPKTFIFQEKSGNTFQNLKARLDNPKRIAPGEVRKSVSLKTYNLYLSNCSQLKNRASEIKQVVLLLNKFIAYLAHRSSGSPKKLTHLLESYICRNTDILFDKERKEYLKIRALVAKRTPEDNSKMFLHFDYYSQYTFGLIQYLTVPYYYNISRYVRRYSDKLMVSTTYLIDHLYKFHDFGFSWRNLEVTPEIIDVNKAPTLRKLIEDIVNFLGHTHLQYVVSGLYDFKFKKKIAYEINFLSKVSERESAAMNFTLDESQEVKGHFHRKLEHLSREYGETWNKEYIHSKGYIQQSLGDLHYYDQEYDDASVMYKDAIQQISKSKEEGILENLRLLVVVCRIMLKLGLTFERKKSNASALMTYGELSHLVLGKLQVDLKGIRMKKEKEGEKIRVYQLDQAGEKIEGSDASEFRINYFNAIYDQPLFSKTYQDIHKSYTTETIRLLLQPFVAKLHVQDKEKIGGITDKDIELTLKEISFLTKIANEQVEDKILSEYHSKIGDLLHFMNYESKEVSHYNAKEMYLLALKFLGGEHYYHENGGLIAMVFKKLGEMVRAESVTRFEEIKMLSGNLSDLGNAYLGSHGRVIMPIEITIVPQLLGLVVMTQKEIIAYEEAIASWFNENNTDNGLTKALICFLLAYHFYFLNDDHSKASFQCIKILHVLEMNSRAIPATFHSIYLDHITQLTNTILSSIYRSYSSSTRQETERMKEIFKIGQVELEDQFHYVLNNLPSVNEVQELLMLYNLLKLRFDAVPHEPKRLERFLLKYNPSRHSNLNGMFGRLNALNVKIRCNYRIFEEMGYVNLMRRPKRNPKHIEDDRFDTRGRSISLMNQWPAIMIEHEMIQYLIADTIYCLTESIRILKVFGITYISNHSTYGFAYEKRGEWCEFFEDYDAIERTRGVHLDDVGSSVLYQKTRNLIGSQAMPNLKAKYNYEKASFHYTQSIDTHKSKFSYDRMVENMYYLEDDFNDNHLHFFAAHERYKVSVGQIAEKLERCRKKLKDSKIYKVEKYFS